MTEGTSPADPALNTSNMKQFHAYRLITAGAKVARDFEEINAFQRYVAWRMSVDGERPWKKEVKALRHAIERDAFLRMYAEQMLDEVPWEHRNFTTVNEMLGAINYVTTMAPVYRDVTSISWQFPLSALMNFWMMTPSGKTLMRMPQFNNHINDIMAAWGQFLDSPQSRYVLNDGEEGWLNEKAYKYNDLDSYVIPNRDAPYWGWESYNDFFHRRIKPECRPVDAPGDNSVVNSPNDGVAWAVEHFVRRDDAFWLKNQVYSLASMLNHSEFVDRFVGGTVYQTYVNGGADWHGFSAPIDGKVVHAEIVRGYAWTESDTTPPDPMSGPYSQGWAAGVATRGLIYIDSGSERLGMVCVVPIGLTEVSSLTNFVKPGQMVKKGDEMGWFSFGGSSFALVFQPRAIREILVKPPLIGRNDQAEDTLRANQRCALAYLD